MINYSFFLGNAQQPTSSQSGGSFKGNPVASSPSQRPATLKSPREMNSELSLFESLLPELLSLVVACSGPAETTLLAMTSWRYHALLKSKMTNTPQILFNAARNGYSRIFEEFAGPITWLDPIASCYSLALLLEEAILHGHFNILVKTIPEKNFDKIYWKMNSEKCYSAAGRVGDFKAIEFLATKVYLPNLVKIAVEEALSYGHIDFLKSLLMKWPGISLTTAELRRAAVSSANLSSLRPFQPSSRRPHSQPNDAPLALWDFIR